jgi:hypothetical protein
MRTGGNTYGNQAGGTAFYRPAGNGKDIGSYVEDPFRMTSSFSLVIQECRWQSVRESSRRSCILQAGRQRKRYRITRGRSLPVDFFFFTGHSEGIFLNVRRIPDAYRWQYVRESSRRYCILQAGRQRKRYRIIRGRSLPDDLFFFTGHSGVPLAIRTGIQPAVLHSTGRQATEKIPDHTWKIPSG